MPKLTTDIVKAARREFKRGVKVNTILKKLGNPCSRHSLSLVLHNKMYKDKRYGTWLSKNIVTRYTKENKCSLPTRNE